jgi:hypothetical protein
VGQVNEIIGVSGSKVSTSSKIEFKENILVENCYFYTQYKDLIFVIMVEICKSLPLLLYCSIFKFIAHIN